MKEKLIVSYSSLLFTLGAYALAKRIKIDPVPLVMIAGVTGAVIGEYILHKFNKPNKSNKDERTD
jgi:hypothetical protein